MSPCPFPMTIMTTPRVMIGDYFLVFNIAVLVPNSYSSEIVITTIFFSGYFFSYYQ